MTGNAFIYGRREDVVRYAKRKHWRPSGRASWVTPSDVCVHFLAFENQLAAISRGERVYVMRKLIAREARTLKNVGAVVFESRGAAHGAKGEAAAVRPVRTGILA